MNRLHMCPICIHRRTISNRQGNHPSVDVFSTLAVRHYRPPAAGGNPGMGSRWTPRYLECESCGCRLTYEDAAIIMDAACAAAPHLRPSYDGELYGPARAILDDQ